MRLISLFTPYSIDFLKNRRKKERRINPNLFIIIGCASLGFLMFKLVVIHSVSIKEGLVISHCLFVQVLSFLLDL